MMKINFDDVNDVAAVVGGVGELLGDLCDRSSVSTDNEALDLLLLARLCDGVYEWLNKHEFAINKAIKKGVQV